MSKQPGTYQGDAEPERVVCLGRKITGESHEPKFEIGTHVIPVNLICDANDPPRVVGRKLWIHGQELPATEWFYNISGMLSSKEWAPLEMMTRRVAEPYIVLAELLPTPKYQVGGKARLSEPRYIGGSQEVEIVGHRWWPKGWAPPWWEEGVDTLDGLWAYQVKVYEFYGPKKGTWEYMLRKEGPHGITELPGIRRLAYKGHGEEPQHIICPHCGWSGYNEYDQLEDVERIDERGYRKDDVSFTKCYNCGNQFMLQEEDSLEDRFRSDQSKIIGGERIGPAEVAHYSPAVAVAMQRLGVASLPRKAFSRRLVEYRQEMINDGRHS